MSAVVVVGSGVAGMTAALEASAHHDVTLLTKAGLAESSTRYAQGGVAVVLSEDDSVDAHVHDTLVAGAGLCEEPAVRVLCAGGPAAIGDLVERGVAFDGRDGVPALGLEAAHSHARILHAGGDATGAAIAHALVARVRESAVVVREHTTVVDLVVADGRCTGVRLLDGSTVPADVVVLATGGAGQLYPRTTNPEVATADGLAMALRAGVVAADLEHVQFHPTALAAPGSFLVSEAVRGEGAVLVDVDGERFMPAVHPDAELAPRDVVARGIADRMARQHGTPVRLDATGLGAAFLAERFPTIDAACRALGMDWASEPVPVTPAAHYVMGGIRTDRWGRTSLPGLLAVGEVACNGLHGANRLASNSLLEGAVYGARVARALDAPAEQEAFDASWCDPEPVALLDDAPGEGRESFARSDLQQLMWDAAGLRRDADGLRAAAAELATWRTPVVRDAKSAEDANLLVVARAVVASALWRAESRGGHFRSDFPEPDPGRGVHSGVVAR